MTYFVHIESPVGELLLTGDRQILQGLYFNAYRHKPCIDPAWAEDSSPFAAVRHQLDEYFAGKRQEFNMALTHRGTPFQEQVWAALQSIPYGQHLTYQEIANLIGHPSAPRAVGNAVGSNPLAIIIPCHRVLTTAGKISGFGGSVPAKRHLLKLEQNLGSQGGPM